MKAGGYEKKNAQTCVSVWKKKEMIKKIVKTKGAEKWQKT